MAPFLKPRSRGGTLARRHYIWGILLLALILRAGGLNKSIEVDEMHSLDWAKPEGVRQPYKHYTAGRFDAYETCLQVYKISNLLAYTGSDAIVRLPYLAIGL